MKPFAIEPDDRAFAVARAGVVLASSPSAVSDGSAVEAAGADAWRAVRQLPTTTSTRHLGSVLREAQPSARALSLVLAELARRLAAHPPAAGERIWIAAPAGAERFGLGALLGVARQLALPVDGFVDAAVVSAAALGGTGAAIVVELGLHHVAATLIERDGGPTCRRRSLVSPRGGLWQLYQGWLDLINTAMVRQTRFDALHDAATEQQLFDALPRLARDAMAQGVATAALTTAGERVEVPITRDQLAHAAQPVWREIARLLHELRPAGGALTLLVPRAVAGFPGVREALAQFAGCELVSLPDGFAAAATSLLDLTPRSATEPVRLLRRLPSGAEPALAALALRESAQADAPWLADHAWDTSAETISPWRRVRHRSCVETRHRNCQRIQLEVGAARARPPGAGRPTRGRPGGPGRRPSGWEFRTIQHRESIPQARHRLHGSPAGLPDESRHESSG